MQIVYSISQDCSGYSQAGRDYILALDSVNEDVKFDRILVSANLDGYGIANQEQNKLDQLSKKVLQSDYVRIHHSVPDRFYIDPEALLNIGFTVAESDKIPPRWVEQCNKMDAIFTASSFCKDVFTINGITVPIVVIPHCHNTKKWNKQVKPLAIANNKYKHRFLFAGDITDRKGINEIINVWSRIPNTKNASLTIKGYYKSFSEEDQACLKEYVCSKFKSDKMNKVLFYGHCLDGDLIPRFYKSFDYIVSPNKGEGFGLIPFEGIFLGVPPIVTAATGNLEYADDKNALLIETDGVERATKELLNVNSNFSGASLIKINSDHLHGIIKSIIDGDLKFKISDEAYNQFVERFSYQTTGSLIRKSIDSLLDQ